MKICRPYENLSIAGYFGRSFTKLYYHQVACADSTCLYANKSIVIMNVLNSVKHKVFKGNYFSSFEIDPFKFQVHAIAKERFEKLF